MQILPYLFNRQIGTHRRLGLRASDYRLNVDNLLSSLVCLQINATHAPRSCVPSLACKFRRDKQNDLLAVADEDGYIMLYDTNYENKVVEKFLSNHNAVFDICWLPDQYCLLTGSGDHSVCLWDMNSSHLITSFNCHTASVKSVDACSNQTDIIASGSRDGSICVWDRREANGKIMDKAAITINSAHNRKRFAGDNRRQSTLNSSHNLSSVSAVAFQDSLNLASAGVSDGAIKIWDLRKSYILKNGRIPAPKYQLQYSAGNPAGHGCTSLMFDTLFKKLYACSTTHNIYQFDCHSYSQKFVTYEGIQCNTYFVKLALSCDDQYLLCGSSNKKACIWKTSQPGLPMWELKGHSAEVTSVAWSPNSVTKLATIGDDNSILVWKTQNIESLDPNDIFVAATNFIKDETTPVFSSSTSPISPQHVVQSSFATPTHSPSTTGKTPTITSFFQPLTPPSTSNNTSPTSSTSLSPTVERMPMSSTSLSPDVERMPTSLSPDVEIMPTTSRSPCKIINDISPSGSGVAKLVATPVGKENGGKVGMKRKLDLRKVKSKFCKYHPEGCGKKNGHERCGKKQEVTPQNYKYLYPEGTTIERYFKTSLSPEN